MQDFFSLSLHSTRGLCMPPCVKASEASSCRNLREGGGEEKFSSTAPLAPLLGRGRGGARRLKKLFRFTLFEFCLRVSRARLFLLKEGKKIGKILLKITFLRNLNFFISRLIDFFFLSYILLFFSFHFLFRKKFL